VLGGAFLLAACTSSPTTTGGDATESPRAAVSRPSDPSVSAWVREAFDLDPRVASGDIGIDTTDGVVTLSGTASNLVEKRYAKLEAGKIDGVTGVIDEIAVAPSDRSDKDLEKDLENRLARSPHADLRELTVSVSGGEVTLRGNVSSWALREQAEMLSSEVRGVRSVMNELNVELGRNPSDDAKRDAIVAALDRDVYLVGLPIEVTVENGRATLDGTVGNAYERQRAEGDARLAAPVEQVDNRLYVDWFEERGVRERSPHPDEAQLKDAVRVALNMDSRLADPDAIAVDVDGSRVTLSGSVPYLTEKRLAEDDARNVVGVTNVKDLVYSTEETRGDRETASAVTIEFYVDYALNGKDLGVEVKDGEVTLTGQVDSYFQKRHAEEVASRVAGVRGVINDIEVITDPGFTDDSVKERIKKHLATNWKTRPVAETIHVDVQDGSVVLSGSVDSWSERVEAERLARLTEGVVRVEDDLVVPYADSAEGSADKDDSTDG
jgi:osmotically-inducible protein OsmY